MLRIGNSHNYNQIRMLFIPYYAKRTTKKKKIGERGQCWWWYLTKLIKEMLVNMNDTLFSEPLEVRSQKTKRKN